MIEQQDIFREEEDHSLMAAFAWWEKKRILYNLMVGLCGIITLLLLPSFEVADIAGALIYGVLANMFYCLGFFFEICSRNFFRSSLDLESRRRILFNFGLAIAMLCTLGMAVILNFPLLN